MFGSLSRRDIRATRIRLSRRESYPGRVSRPLSSCVSSYPLYCILTSLACVQVSALCGIHNPPETETSFIGMPDPPVQRTLTLIAKVIQSLANLNIVRLL